VLEVRGVSKEYVGPGGTVRVLSGIDLEVRPGQSLAIVGPSGSGKSTLLYILGALETPSSGTVVLNGQNPSELGEAALAAFRNSQVGFVFQDHHLLPQCSVLENVLVPTLVAKSDHRDAAHRARDLVARVGLGPRIEHRPHQLSGGEKQRVAIARALVRNPPLVLCDEPTGNLDYESAEGVIALLLGLHASRNGMLVVVTHNPDLAGRMDAVLTLRNGYLL
jgi:lipoprotein-releasing system ATP-binding protein